MASSSNNRTSEIILSVVVTAHAEGDLIYKTLASVYRSIETLGENYRTEIVLHADKPTKETIECINHLKTAVSQNFRFYTNSFGDLGLSRNFAIKQARGKYIATIDADDIMSAGWLNNALRALENCSEPTIAHSELTVEFEGTDGLVIKHGEIDKTHDTLLSVFANRWNSVIVAPRSILLNFPYTANSPGYGYEDWHLNCRLIEAGIHNVLIPETVIFVRRKKENSEWLRQKQSMAVLRANPLLSLGTVRKLKSNPFANDIPALNPIDSRLSMKKLIKRHPFLYRVARHAKRTIRRPALNSSKFIIPEWLKKEWRDLHAIENGISLTPMLARRLPIYDSLTPDHRLAGGLYKHIVDNLRFDTYDYLLFVPWLIKGGADSYAINYANTIASLKPDKRVLVVATLPVSSVWKGRLNNAVDFLDFGNLTRGVELEIQYRLLSHLVENSSITHIHIINSELGYDFIRLHEKYIQSTGKKVVLTAFSQSVDKNGNVFGYSHTHVPPVYHLASMITSDNQAIVNMWMQKYKFDPKKLLVHRQPVTELRGLRKHHKNNKPLRVLWAARIAPEKLPELLAPIGKNIGDDAIIDVYGTIENDCKEIVNDFPKNVRYRGEFNGLSSLPLDNYDCMLYTSLFDGMPNTILEASTYGLPIVASSVGGIPEFIKNEKTGLLVTDTFNPKAYTEALYKLLLSNDLGQTLALNAQSELKSSFSEKSYIDAVTKMLNILDY